MGKSIVRKVGKIDGSQFLQRLNSLRSLHSKLCHVVGSIFQFSAFRVMRHTPVPVFLNVRRIHDKQVFLRLIMIDQKVVYNASVVIGEAGILYFPRCEGSYVIGSHFLQKVQSMGTFHPEFSHV